MKALAGTGTAIYVGINEDYKRQRALGEEKMKSAREAKSFRHHDYESQY